MIVALLASILAVPAWTQCVPAGTAWKNHPIASQSAPFTARFTASASGANIDGVTGLSLSPATGFPSLAVAVRFNNAGFLDARNGGIYQADASIPYTPGAVYAFRLAVDPAAKRYSVWVAAPGAAEKALATNYAFRTEQAGASILGHWALIAASGGHQVCAFMITAPAEDSDRFGVRKLYASAADGMEWLSAWDNGKARAFVSGQSDPDDPWLRGRGRGAYAADGKGIFSVSGPAVRLYIHDPARERDWRNTESTVYAYRVADGGVPWGGIVHVTRTNHSAIGASETVNACDSRGNGARFRYDGRVDFHKETRHPNSKPAKARRLWPSLPYKTWIGYKLVVYDLPNGNVKLESWLDLTDGADGGTWTKVNELEDTGSNFGVGGKPCRRGIDPALRLTAGNDRPGSETGRPNAAVYFRSDGVGENGLLYKKMSVREIAAPPILDKNLTGAPSGGRIY